MNRQRIARELLAVARDLTAAEMTADEFIRKLTAAYKSQFPRAFFVARLSSRLGESIVLRFGVQPKGDWINGIFHNDPAASSAFIYGVKDGQLQDAMEVRMSIGGILIVKPTESHMAYGRVKLGWRNRKGTPEQILKHMAGYFRKMRHVVDSTRDQHAHEID